MILYIQRRTQGGTRRTAGLHRILPGLVLGHSNRGRRHAPAALGSAPIQHGVAKRREISGINRAIRTPGTPGPSRSGDPAAVRVASPALLPRAGRRAGMRRGKHGRRGAAADVAPSFSGDRRPARRPAQVQASQSQPCSRASRPGHSSARATCGPASRAAGLTFTSSADSSTPTRKSPARDGAPARQRAPAAGTAGRRSTSPQGRNRRPAASPAPACSHRPRASSRLGPVKPRVMGLPRAPRAARQGGAATTWRARTSRSGLRTSPPSAMRSDTTGSAGTSAPARSVTSRPPRVPDHTGPRPSGRGDTPSRPTAISTRDNRAPRRTTRARCPASLLSAQAH
jgi:hypothetical protein